MRAAQNHVADDGLARNGIGDPDYRGLGDCGMVDQGRFDLRGGDPVTGHIHHVVDPA